MSQTPKMVDVEKAKLLGGNPVTLLSPIKFRDIEVSNKLLPGAIETLLDLKVNMEGNGTKGVELTEPSSDILWFSMGGSRKIATTCREYQSLIDKGWYGATTVDMIDQNSFIKTCDLMRILKAAKPAQNTNFSNDFQWKELNNLPRALYYYFLEPAEEYKCKESLSLLECVSQDKGEITQNNNALFIKVDGGEYQYSPKARGDFNGDGWEEILLYHFYHAPRGSLVNYSYVCLNWSGEQASLALTDCGKAAD